MTSLDPVADELDQLYSRVTAAILLAERAEAAGGVATAAAAYLEVSFFEEEIAKLLPANNPEGEIARRGVITAAMSARQFVRAIELAKAYAQDPAASATLKQQLETLRGEAEREARRSLRGPILVQPRATFRLLAA
jgi:hypothetical protein